MTNPHPVSCAYCGNTLTPGATVCAGCGAQVPQAPPTAPGVISNQAPGPFGAPGLPPPPRLGGPGSPPPPFGVPPQGSGFSSPGFSPQGSPPPTFQFGSPPPTKASIQWASFIWIPITLIFVGIGVYTSMFGFGLPGGCAQETPTPIVLNQTLQGEVTTFHSHRLYELVVDQPTQVVIAVQSDWDNFLELYLGNASQPMMQNDDTNGLNAMLTATLAPGTYFILVRAFSEGTGPFTLSVTGSPLVAPQAPPVYGYPQAPPGAVYPQVPGAPTPQ